MTSAQVRGYTPPFVQKALDGPGEGGESPYSEHTLSLLAGPDGTVPEEVQKLDPKIVDQVRRALRDLACGYYMVICLLGGVPLRS